MYLHIQRNCIIISRSCFRMNKEFFLNFYEVKYIVYFLIDE